MHSSNRNLLSLKASIGHSQLLAKVFINVPLARRYSLMAARKVQSYTRFTMFRKVLQFRYSQTFCQLRILTYSC